MRRFHGYLFGIRMKRKTYIAALDYGKRNSEVEKRVMQFGNHAVTLYRRPDAFEAVGTFEYISRRRSVTIDCRSRPTI
jgi:hypothetical protein